jgi:hypothetical protein
MIMGQRGDVRIVTSRTAIQTAFLNAALDTLPEHVGSVGKCSCRRRSRGVTRLIVDPDKAKLACLQVLSVGRP